MKTLQPPIERLILKTKKSANGCIMFVGGLTTDGYGQLGVNRRLVGAHRVSFEFFNGPIPSGFEVDHLCFSPGCVNPLHLEAVTPRENNLRSRGFAAVNARKTHCVNGHQLDEANTYIRPDGGRGCRACNLAAVSRYKRKGGAA